MKARKRTERLRFLLVVVLVCLFLGAIGAGVKIWFYPKADIPGRQAEPLSDKAAEETVREPENLKVPENSIVKRNNIYNRNLKELALSFLLASVYVKPLEIRKEEGAIQKLAELLDLNEQELALSVASERGFVWLARNIDREMAGKIKQLDISGVHLVQEGVRFYPEGKHASHVIGFSKGGQGLAGVESYYDNILAGKVEVEAANMAAAGIPAEAYLEKTGISLILTIDWQIQENLETMLAKVISDHDARSGMAMIMHNKTGEVLGLANYPGFDCNLFWKYDSFERRNRMLTDPVKLGAFQYIIRMAAEMAQGHIPDYISEPEEIAEVIIEPKLMKKVVSERLRRAVNPIWKELAEGIYWPALDKPYQFNLNEEELREFAVSYGLAEEAVIDLPMTRTPEMDQTKGKPLDFTDLNASATGLQTLEVFNRLLNEGKRAAPHVLKEIWLEQQGEMIATAFEQEAIEAEPGLGRNIIRLIQALSAEPRQGEVIFETLIEEKDEAREQGLEFSQEQNSPEEREENGNKQMLRCQDVVLGAIPSLNPELSMIMVIDGMLLDLSKTSKLQLTASQILQNGLKTYNFPSKVKNADRYLQEKELYEKWSRLHAKDDVRQISKSREAQEMPSVLHLSLRKALQVLQNYNLRIRVEGSGRVVSQHPSPGTMLQEVNECVLELKIDN